MISATMIERLGPEEMITYLRIALWHERREVSNLQRLADEVWFRDLWRAEQWINALERRGLITDVEGRFRAQYGPEMFAEWQRRKHEQRDAQFEREVLAGKAWVNARKVGRLEQASQTVASPRIAVPTEPTEEDGSWVGEWPLPDSAARPPKGQSVVYVLYGKRDRAVYVGSTDNFQVRMKAHQAGGKRWNSWTAFPCADREEAYEVEAEYLDEYMPQLNVQGPQRRKEAGDR
jgi:hypothetical protein